MTNAISVIAGGIGSGIGSIFGFVGSIIKYGFYTTIITVIIGAFVAYQTKPHNNSFDKHMKDKATNDISDEFGVKKNSVKTRGVIGIATDFGYNVAKNTVMDVVIKDYVFIKVATVEEGTNNKKYYIGTFNNWFEC